MRAAGRTMKNCSGRCSISNCSSPATGWASARRHWVNFRPPPLFLPLQPSGRRGPPMRAVEDAELIAHGSDGEMGSLSPVRRHVVLYVPDLSAGGAERAALNLLE